MNHGHEIRLSGKGEEIPDAKPGIDLPGDVMIRLEQKPHPVFEREGPNLSITRDVLLTEALCGTKVLGSVKDSWLVTLSSLCL